MDFNRDTKAWPSGSYIHRNYTWDTQNKKPPPSDWERWALTSLWTHRSALHFFGLPQSSRLGQEDSLAYVSELESLSPRKRFLCFHEAYTPKAYFEKKDKPTHRTPGDELLQEHQWLVGPWDESYSEGDGDAWGACWCSGLKWSTPQPVPGRLP